MCKLYDSKEKEIDLLSSAVDNNSFEGEFKVEEAGKYTIACANYEGGDFKKTSIEIEEPEEIEYTVEFNTNGGSNIKEIKVKENEKISKPEDPKKEGFAFEGWYEDEEFKTQFNFDSKIKEDKTLYAKWVEESEETNKEEYKLSDDNENEIIFTEEKDRNFHLNIINYLNMTDEKLEELEIPKDLYNEVFNKITEATKKQGTLLAFYEIRVYDENDSEIKEGPFKIRIKITEEMKKYNSFKLIYFTEDNTAGDITELTKEGDYLVGTLPHLSNYALVGNVKTENPKTGDNIYKWLGISVISLLGISLVITNTKKSKVKR